MNQNPSDISLITNGLVDTVLGIITLDIFITVNRDYQMWTTITQGEGTILVVLTGLAAIFGVRLLAYGLPKIVSGLLSIYAETDSGKNFLNRFQKNETL
jgi:hypothetical protein